MNRLLILLLFLMISTTAQAQVFLKDKVNELKSDIPAIIDIRPSSMTFTEPEDTKFITKEVKVLNRGGSVLEIGKTESSCNCSSVRILENYIEPMTTGKLYVAINTDGVFDNNRTLEFIVHSNAKNSPTAITVYIAKRKEDSVPKPSQE